jgi:plastocyanin
MPPRVLCALVLGLTGIGQLSAGDIQGTVIVKHKLTRRKVTASSGAYERGRPVVLGSCPFDKDSLAYERSHVVVYVDGEPPSDCTSAPIQQKVQQKMEQKDREFQPDLLTIPCGSTVSFPNLDPIFHNVFSLSKPKTFDLGNYNKGQARSVTFLKPGIVLVNCRLHTNMTAAIVITPNQWSSRADADGRFVLRGVPAGIHTLIAWHKAAGFLRQTVTVSDSRTAIVEFPIPLDENGVPVAHR